MKSTPYFTFTASERSGLFLLLAIISGLQLGYYFIDVTLPEDNSQAKREWLALQPEIDSLKKQQPVFTSKIYPFNPNFITDYKGYKLGMSTAEIDRLLVFRKGNKYVNSATEFQAVTKVSDSLLSAMSPYFKFPDWVKERQKAQGKRDKKDFQLYQKTNPPLLDINIATKEDLMKVYGIGPALSDRILKQKEVLGGFVSMEQMNDVWGLSPEVVEKLRVHFKVATVPNVKKIAINNASVKELAQFPYFRYALAKEIITYRSMKGKIASVEDLIKIPNFPVEKVNIIAVYLEF